VPSPISSTRFAAEAFIRTVNEGRAPIEAAERQATDLGAELETRNREYSQADLETLVDAAARQHVAAYNAEFGDRMADIHRRLLVASVEAASGALLQLAKQGVALVHRELLVRGKLSECPPGRAIGSQPLRDVIWYARNQAIHWEEGVYRTPTLACFAKLESDFGARFHLDADVRESRAFAVCALLGWRDYARFKEDMRSLLDPMSAGQ
jgi:hypothetical protein